MYPGEVSSPVSVRVAASKVRPNLVAITTSSHRPDSALPSTRSLCPVP
jgi:hypothetical protein